jgi:hypothetical protein
LLTLLTCHGSLGGVKPFWYEAKQSWAVDIPRRMSPTGKRQRKFFPSRDKAREFCGERKEEHVEHGKAAVTAHERAVIVTLRKELGGNLDLVPEILRHWKRTAGESITKTRVKPPWMHFKRRGSPV